jgi:putative sugar O-methyltransferase
LWQDLGPAFEALVEHGLDQFKRTVNLQYSSGCSPASSAISSLRVRAWLAHPDRDVFPGRFDASSGSPTGRARALNRAAAWVYRAYVSMLASVLSRHDELGLLDGRVQEPRIGNPLIVRYRGVELSQDLCNSVHEFYRVVGHLPAGAGRAPRVAELGAGYGRLAFVFLKAMPEVRYCIIDIPPALCLAQWYLTTVLPGVAAFRFREFSTFDEVREEFEYATLLFLALIRSSCFRRRRSTHS